MQMQPLPQPSRCVHTPVAPGTRAGTRGDTSILHPPSYPLTSYILTSYLPSYSELNPNTAKNHPLRLSEQKPSRLLYGERCSSHIGRWLQEGSIHPSMGGSLPRTCQQLGVAAVLTARVCRCSPHRTPRPGRTLNNMRSGAGKVDCKTER